MSGAGAEAGAKTGRQAGRRTGLGGRRASAGRMRATALLVNGGFAAVTVLLFVLLLPAAGAAGEPGMAERLARALRLAAWPSVVVLLMVGATALSRFAAAAFDPLSDPEPRLYRVNQRVLANSVEQAVIFVPLFLALATVLPPGRLDALPLVAGVYTVARLLFWAGYLIHPYARAPGMAATFTITIGMAVTLGWWALG